MIEAAIPLAHFGHWSVSLAVFMGPVLVLGGFLAIVSWRDRRREPDR